MDLLYAGLGLLALLGAGDSLVRGAVALSLRLGISALIVSLTVVAFGTSAPELLISIQAAVGGSPGIAIGNVVGSNIANVLLVLGLPAMIAPFCDRTGDGQRSFWMMIAASVFFIALCFLGVLVWWHGVLMLGALAVVLWHNYRSAMKSRAFNEKAEAEELAELEDVDPHMAPWKIAALIGIGLVGLPIGAHFLIEGARGIAIAAGISEAAIGLSLVAVGTSLPELATTVAAAIRKQADVAIGNIIGSNLFNILAIMGAAVMFAPIPVPPEFLKVDLWVMLAGSLALYPIVALRLPLGRPLGLLFLIAYAGFMIVVLGDRM